MQNQHDPTLATLAGRVKHALLGDAARRRRKMERDQKAAVEFPETSKTAFVARFDGAALVGASRLKLR
jgi:hypothetical protein